MKKNLNIPNSLGYCKYCFDERREGSSYCGNCRNSASGRMQIFMDDRQNFPLINLVSKTFEIDDHTIFTYGNTVYFNRDLSYDLVAHEIIHVFQQTEMDPKKWWRKYIEDEKFRLDQEVEAYKRQYQVMKRNDDVKAALLLDSISSDLSGKLYGEIVSFEEANKLISK
jgi:hypothetical protein